jgi:hypothetical protein
LQCNRHCIFSLVIGQLSILSAKNILESARG